MNEKLKAFERLLQIMDELREQCPWDRKQTIQSLRNLTIEETYELADAISKEDYEGIKEELGDIMLHMVFYARIASEKGAFDVSDVLNGVCEKLIQRHPHIYGDLKLEGAEEVKQNWERIKLKEGKKSVLGGVPNSLPALIKAYRMQEKTAQFGFEWERPEQVWGKVTEEMEELQQELHAGGDKQAVEEEYGDLLFALVNYGRFIHVDPESALEKTNKKFKTRFEYIENHSTKPLSEMNLMEMDALWEEAKRKGL